MLQFYFYFAAGFVVHIVYFATFIFLHVWKAYISAIVLLSGVPDYFYRNKISSGGDLSHYSSASLY